MTSVKNSPYGNIQFFYEKIKGYHHTIESLGNRIYYRDSMLINPVLLVILFSVKENWHGIKDHDLVHVGTVLLQCRKLRSTFMPT